MTIFVICVGSSLLSKATDVTYVFRFLCAFTVFDVVDFVLILLCKYTKIQMF